MKKQYAFDLLLLILVILLFIYVRIPYLSTILSFLIIMVYSYTTEGLKISLGFSSQKNKLKLFGTALGVAIAMVAISYFVLLSPIERLTGQPLQFGIFGGLKDNFNLYITSVLIGFVVGGLFEEVIFRGFIISKFMNILGEKAGALITILFSSVFFGSLHAYQGLTGQILIGITGAVLGVIYVVSKRNLWLTILIHAFTNTISISMLYFGLLS